MGTWPALRAGFFYMVTGGVRLLVMVGVLSTLSVEAHQQGMDNPLAVFIHHDYGLAAQLLLATLVVVAGPIGEEMLFRGVLVPSLARWLPSSAAIVLTAGIFGVLHLGSHGLGAIVPAYFGVVLGWTRIQTGGLLAPCLLHMGTNGFALGAAWLLLAISA